MLALGACSKGAKTWIITAVTQVSVIFAPDDNRYIKLQPATSATVLFEMGTGQGGRRRTGNV